MLLRERILAALNFTEIQPLRHVVLYDQRVGQRLDAYYGSQSWRERVNNAFA